MRSYDTEARPRRRATASAALASIPAQGRARVLLRLAELRDLDRLIRQPGTLAEPEARPM